MAAQQIGVVSASKGEVFARNAEGQTRRLAVGDPVFEGDVVVTAAGSTVEITPFDGPAINVAEQQTMLLDSSVVSGQPASPADGGVSPQVAGTAATVIQAENADFNVQLEEEAAAAGLTGGGAEGGHSFVNLLRIAELTEGVSYEFPLYAPPPPPVIEGEVLNNGLPTAGSVDADVNEDNIVEGGGNRGGVGDIGVDVLSTSSGNLAYSFGPDGPAATGAFTWLGVTVNAPDGILMSGGEEITIQVRDDGLVMGGVILGEGGEVREVVFEVRLTNTATGAYEFELFGPLDHLPGDDENDMRLTFNFRVTDRSGDSADGTLNMTVDDDTPVLLGSSEEYGNVVTGTIYGTAYLNQGQGEDSEEEGEPPTSTVDGWFFTVNSAGTVTIDTRSMEPNGEDVNNDGEIAYFDPYIYVFTNDNGQPGELIASNDDSSSTFGDGSVHHYDSFLSLNLQPGNYILKIGAFYMSEEEARSGVNQDGSYPIGPNGPIDHGDYQITFGGDVTVTAGPKGGPAGDVVMVEEESVPYGEDGVIGNDEDDGYSYTATGTVVDNVSWGADGFGAVTAVTIGSGETAVSFDVPRGGSITAYFDAHGNLLPDAPVTESYTEGTGPMPFDPPAASLVVNSDGTYTFTVLTAMTHEGEGEDALELPAITVTGVDFDGDPVNVPLSISVQDDVPVMRDASVSATVDEDDIKTYLSSGNYPNDGAGEDGSFTGSPYSGHDSGPANVRGSIAALVSFGADGPGNNGFSLSNDLSGLYEQELTSKGEGLDYAVVDGVLYGYVSNGEPNGEDGPSLRIQDDSPVDGRVVFTLQLDSDGDYHFSLFDQLDHEPPTGEDGSSDENTLSIDLSSAILATDADGDTITLSDNFTINVTDDVPKQAGRDAEIGIVEEEGLPGGNREGWSNATVAYGSLRSQVAVGADEQVTFSLSEDMGGLPRVTSDGDPVSYRVEGNTLYAEVVEPQYQVYSTGEDSPEPEVRPIFTLTLEADGRYTFTLLDQVDHSGYGEDWMGLDLSSMIVATDFDGDSITLNRDFYIKIVDDVPVVSVGGPGSVAEDAAAINGTWNVSMGADQTGSIKVVVNGSEYNVGEPISVVESDWWATPQTVGTLTVNANGTWTFDPNPNLDNLGYGWFEHWVRDTTFSFSIKATDADGDTVTDSQTIQVRDGTDPTGRDVATLALDEEALGNLNATGTNPGSNAEQASDTLSFTAGSDDLSAFAFSSDLNNLVRNTDNQSGNELRWVRDSDTQITGHFGSSSGPVAITLSLSAPGSIPYGTTGSVTVTATLSDNLKHAIANGEQTLDLGSVRVYAYDHDGDSTYGTVTLSVKDDVPLITNTTSVSVDEEGLGGNAGDSYATGDLAGEAVTASGNLGVSFGADGAATAGAGFALSSAGATWTADTTGATAGTLAANNGSWTIKVQTNGQYDFTLLKSMSHATAGTEDDATINVSFTATDRDGDTRNGSFTVTVDDDAPVITKQNIQILQESFENLFGASMGNNSWTVVGETVGSEALATKVGDHGVTWTLNAAGVEMRTGNIAGSAASDGNAYVELDAHNIRGGDPSTLSVLSTQVNLPSSEISLSFDYRPRGDLSNKSDADMKVSLGGREVTIDSNASGVVTISVPAGVTAVQTTVNGWTHVTLAFSGLDTSAPATLSFAGLSSLPNGDTYGAYLDNINMIAEKMGLTVDETNLGVDATANFSGFFTGLYGADGAGDMAYGLSVNGGSTGIVDTATGENVVLSVNAGVVEGRTATSNALVFTVSVDTASGEVELDQIRAVRHADTTNPDDTVQLNSGLINLTATITDADGDSKSATVDASAAMYFRDDGPEAGGAENIVLANGAEPIVTNLILTLDTSGSMGDRVNDGDPNTNPNPTRLDILKASMNRLIDQYEAQGGVMVQITTFNTTAGESSAWLTAVQAKNLIAALTAGGNTNYEDALFETAEGNGASTPPADQTMAYFVSDGEPTVENYGIGGSRGQSIIGSALDSDYLSVWTTFVGDGVDHLFVVGVGNNLNTTYLQEIAGAAGTDGEVVLVNNPLNLSAELDVSVAAAPSATASLGIDIGADGWGTAQITDVATRDDGSASVRYVTALAANGDAIIATSDGVKLVYVNDGNGGMEAVKEGTDEVVFTMTLNKATGSYTVTMLGKIDAHVVEQQVNDSTPGVFTLTGSSTGSTVIQAAQNNVADSVTFSTGVSTGGNSVTGPEFTVTENGITFKMVTSADDTDSNSTFDDKVNWSANGLGVGEGQDISDGEKLKLVISATGGNDVKITSMDVTLAHLGWDETAAWDVAGTSTGDGSFSPSSSQTTRFGNESTDFVRTINLSNAGATPTIVFTETEDEGGGYRIDGGGVKINYTYDVPEVTRQTTVETYTKVDTVTSGTVVTAYDVTLLFQLDATDGDGDPVGTQFHVTVDANNDGVMNAVDSDSVVGVVLSNTVETVETTTTHTEEYYLDGGGNKVFVDPVADSTTTETSPYVVDPTASGDDAILAETVDGLIDSTDNDVMVGGSLDNILSGGEGADTFVWTLADAPSGTPVTDTVMNFEAGDTLQLNDLLSGPGASVAVTAGSDTIINIVDTSGIDQTIVLENYSTDQAAADLIKAALESNHQYTAGG